ncbi:MAG TPA: RidA family protein [Afifellaceae bacterium]|nr:RidA family protein [Afifellaceae bacterium]
MPENKSIQRFGMAPPGAGGQPLPFAKAVRAGDFVYVSGQVAMRDGEIVAGGIIDQARITFDNIKQILEEAGCGLEDVVKVNVWLDDPRDFWSFNKVFAEYFQGHPPARSTVQSLIMVDAKIEADVIAYKPR